MGKKNKKSKKIKNLWDLTAEEQEMQADKLYELEKGKIDIMDLAGINPSLNDNGLSSGIEELIVKDLTKREEVVSLNGGRTNMEILTGKAPTGEDYNIVSTQTRTIDTTICEEDCRKVSFNTEAKDLYRIVVEDGIAPTSYSLLMGIEQELDGTYDADDVYAKCETLFEYIISLKHPTAVYSAEEFLNSSKYNFTRVACDKYDSSKFKFISSNGYVLCYLVDDKSVITMKELFDESGYDDKDLLKIYVSLAYACGTVMQAFFIEDEWYINEFKGSKYNQKRLFHEIFVNDENTCILPDDTESIDDDGVYVTNAEYLHKDARDIIETVTGEEYFDSDDDDEEDDDFDYEDLPEEISQEIVQLQAKYKEENKHVENNIQTEKAVEETVRDDEEKVTPKNTTTLEVTQTTTVAETTTEDVDEEEDEEDDYDDLLSEEMVVVEKKEVTKIKTSNDDEFKIAVVRKR